MEQAAKKKLARACAPLLLCCCAVASGLVGAGERGEPNVPGKPVEEAVARAGFRGPTFAEIYAKYLPDFAVDERTMARWREQPDDAPDWPKFSLQKRFDNRAYLERDWRVPPIVKRADELMGRGEHREAMRLYQRVIEKYPDDMWSVSEHGVFVPTTLYCQRQLLKLPPKELDYYRTVYDPYAKPLFEKAKKHYSPLDFAYVAYRFCATSYGSAALYELGNAALDAGNFEKACYYYERIRNYHRSTAIDQGELGLRLLTCYKKLGNEKAYAGLKARLEADAGAAGAPMRNFLKEVDRSRTERPDFFSQKASPDALSLADYTLFEPLVPDVSNYDSTWTVKRELGWRFRHPDSLIPVIAGNNLLYKDKNIVYCRSLLTGDLKWEYTEGGLVWDFEKVGTGRWSAYDYYPYQDLAVYDGMVYTFIVKGGPSLVALDLTTGERRWAAGPMAAASKSELDDRYAARPAVGAGRVYATVVHDDVEGDAHLSSTVAVAAFESRNGKLLWRRTLCRLTPSKFTISRIRRKIRIFCSPPVYKNGVVYACTNAGVFAAVDADTGEARWITRYDHKPVMLDALVLPDMHRDKLFCTNTAPIVFGLYLLAMPVDNSSRLYCLDRFTGKVLWSRVGEGQALRLVGVWKGQVVVGGSQALSGWDIPTGEPRLSLKLVEGGAEFRRGMQVIGRGGKVHSSGWRVHGLSHTYYDVVAHLDAGPKVIGHRTWYNRWARKRNAERIKQGLEPLVNEEPFFLTKSRMGLRLWGVPCEIEVDGKKITMKYGVAKVQAVLAKARGFQAMYDRAELHQFADRREEAIAEFEKLRDTLPEGKPALRIEVNRQLFRLYVKQAQAALRAGDIRGVAKYVNLMATCPTTSRQEIQTVLSMAEVFSRRKEYERCATCLLAIIRHYRPVQYPISSLVIEEPGPLIQRTAEALGHLFAQAPRQFFDRELALAGQCMSRSVPNYFSLIAPIDPDLRVETGQFASDWVRRVLPKTSAAYRRKYEEAAKSTFAGQEAPALLERLIREYPTTATAQAALDRMAARARKLPPPARNIRLWQLEELAQLNGLKFDAVRAGGALKVKQVPPPPLADAYRTLTHQFNFDEKTSLRLLDRRDGREGGAGLLFLGMRSVRTHAVKHGVICFDAAAGKAKWMHKEMRLKGKGEETGFEEVFIHRGLAIVHGRFDVLAFQLDDGKPAWQFRVPHEFEIEAATPAGDIFVLSSRFSTLAIHYMDGSIVWEAAEQGELYCPPMIAGEALVTVRLNPSGVSFRSLSTGRLMVHLDVPGLTQHRAHPVLKTGGEALPVAFEGGLLVLTDGWDYIGIDTSSRQIRWRIRIEDVDRDKVLPYRLWVSGNHLFVLKQEYDVNVIEMFNASTGERLWRNDHPQQVVYSAVYDAKSLYGINYQRDRTGVDLVGYDRQTGSKELTWSHGAYEQPEVFLCPEPHGDALVARLNDRQNNYALVAFNKKTRKLVHEVRVKGHGLWRNYGEVSATIQGQTLAILSKSLLTYCRPK